MGDYRIQSQWSSGRVSSVDVSSYDAAEEYADFLSSSGAEDVQIVPVLDDQEEC
jgi:hypothetical protein